MFYCSLYHGVIFLLNQNSFVMPIVLKSKTALIFSILFLLVWPALAQRRVNSTIDPIIIAKKHFIKADKPAPGFFEGALLGNGAMGVVVTTRPDAIAIRFGHNNVWDIRIAEQNRDKIGTFQSVFEKVNAIPSNLDHLSNDPWYAEYNRMSGENYSKAYPRPFPCGSLILGFDRRKMSLVGHQLDISNGKCRVELITKNKKTVFLEFLSRPGINHILCQSNSAVIQFRKSLMMLMLSLLLVKKHRYLFSSLAISFL